MKKSPKARHAPGERRWVLFSNGCLHGIRRSEFIVVRSNPQRSLIRNSVSVFTVSRAAGLLALLVSRSSWRWCFSVAACRARKKEALPTL